MKLSAIIQGILLVGLIGCAATESSYKEYGKSEGVFAFVGASSGVGYQDFQVNQDTFFVSYLDAQGGSEATAVKYMNRRAGEVCREHGFSGYELLDKPINGTQSTAAVSSAVYGARFSVSGQPSAQSYVHCVQ